MNNYKSFDFIFLFLINKCILLFKYIDNDNQKNILYEIKLFINKLNEIFSNSDFKNNEEKKNKILEILINYFLKLIDEKIYYLIKDDNKESIIIETERIALNLCENNDKKDSINKSDTEKKTEKKIINNSEINSEKNINKYPEKNSEKNIEKYSDINIERYSEKNIDNNQDYKLKLKELEDRLNNKVITIFNDIEKNIKQFLKNHIEHTNFIEFDLDKKFNGKLDNYIFKIEEKLKELLNNDFINNNINDYIKNQINNIYDYIDKIKNNEINKCIENKIRLLGDIFNNNIEDIFKKIDQKVIKNEEYFIKYIDEKINSNNFNTNNFNIIFDKDLNEIKLLYYNKEVTSTKLNIKGLIGPKGPIGNKGDTGETPIIRKIKFQEDNKLKFTIQENSKIYEVISDDPIPPGPRGLQGERGQIGKTILDLKWNQDNVMRIDEDNKESLIFLKALCIGDKSHCLKDNSLSIAGAKCYQNNSFAIGPNSKTLDSESIALFGTSIGKKSFSYRADNVDENCVIFGKKERSDYNINSILLLAKEINLECDSFKIKTNKYENSKFKELEERIIFIEKKLNDILKKI
jgi:hypothetical protein